MQNSKCKINVVHFAFLIFNFTFAAAEPYPRGFFVEDLRRTPPVPAFYDLESHHLEPFPLKQSYVNFIDFTWDRERGRVFFSARRTAKGPFRIYVKSWPDGEEKAVYENPLGPFRFLVSPDGTRLALQIMGPSAWPTIGVYEWELQKLIPLGQGYSPDWSVDSQRLLFLHIPGALPSWLYEYSVTDQVATQLLNEPVAEAVYTDDPLQIVLKTARQSRGCDVFQLWNRRTGKLSPYSVMDEALCKKKELSQRELEAFPGHRFFLFKESVGSREPANQVVIVMDAWGGRLQSLPHAEWDPQVTPVEETTLAMGEDPLCVLPADGTGRKVEIPQARFIRIRH
jgi:hypothetical protein